MGRAANNSPCRVRYCVRQPGRRGQGMNGRKDTYPFLMPHENFPSSESPQVTLIEYIREAEQARAFLQGEMEYARATRDDLAAQLELLLFYGRAFAGLIRQLPDDAHAEPWQSRILHAAIVGRTAYWEWQRRPTSAVAPLELYQMEMRWGNIVQMMAETFD